VTTTTLTRGLSLATFLQWAGAGAIIPLLPAFLRRDGASDLLVGLAMSAFFFAGVATQYAGGRLSDRLGRRPLLVGGLVLYAAGSLLFLAPLPAVTAVACRALQGVGAGVAQVVAAAVLAEHVPPRERGRAFGLFFGAQIAGLAIGPLVGTTVGLRHMDLLFAGAAALQAMAIVPVVRSVPVRRPAPTALRAAPPTRGVSRLGRTALGVALVAAGGGLLSGTYEAVWTLLLLARHADDLQIGLSFTVFALPYMAVSVPAGWLADRLDRRRLAAVSLLVSAGFASTYPFLRDVNLMIGLAALEAVGGALAGPASQSLLADAIGPGLLGQAQGAVATSQTAATALAAAAAGALFATTTWLPFVLASLMSAAIALGATRAWRDTQGRASHDVGHRLAVSPPPEG